MITPSALFTNAFIARIMISSEPLPQIILSILTLIVFAILALRRQTAASGYRFMFLRFFFMAATAFGEGPRGFSFDANFITRFKHSALWTSSIGFPEIYGGIYSISLRNNLSILFIKFYFLLFPPPPPPPPPPPRPRKER